MKLVRRILILNRIAAQILAIAFVLTLPSSGTGAAARPKRSSAAASVRPSQLIDINHATVGELTSLPGIQDAYAAKIVKNRPYANKTQLSSKGVIPAATYRRIRSLIIAKQ